MIEDTTHRRKKYADSFSDSGGGSQGSVVLSLSLFIILLAFFIVMNAISEYSSSKVEGAFSSIDMAFARQVVDTDFQKQNADETAEAQDGEGDSLESIQGVLRSILPGLDSALTDNPRGGQIMGVRMKKDQFDRLSTRLIPVFDRILNVKDGRGDYNLNITSYVRDPIARSSRLSYNVISQYRIVMVDGGLNPSRVSLAVEKGNPAFLMFEFYKDGW